MSRVRGRGTLPVALAVALVLGCGGDVEERAEEPDADAGGAESMALPPSAGAPRASQPGRTPDTVRPAADTAPAGGEEFEIREGRRRSPEELDLGAIVSTYRQHYREEFVEAGSDVRDRVDPALVEAAKRRVALEWGYVDVGAWSDLLADMTPDQRAVLANRLAAANETLAAELHGPGAPDPP